MVYERYDEYDEDEELLRRIAMLRRRQEMLYRTEIVPYPDGQFYWHLFRRASGERVNGGLSDSWEEAVKAANIAAAYWHRRD